MCWIQIFLFLVSGQSLTSGSQDEIFMGTRWTPSTSCWPFQSYVELELLLTVRNKAVNLVGLKQISSDYSIFLVETKLLWHHMHCCMSVLNVSLNIFAALYMAAACIQIELLHLNKVPLNHTPAALCEALSKHLGKSFLLFSCFIRLYLVLPRYQWNCRVSWHNISLWFCQGFAKICFGPGCPAARN